MKPIRVLLGASLLLIHYMTMGQSGFVVEGRVSDAASGETLPLANIFIANTTYGTSSKQDGSFRLTLPQAGSYDLVISFLGYETFAKTVRFLKPETINIEAKLVVKSRQLGVVTVTAKEDELWKRQLEQFKYGFFGGSKNGRSCKILNKEVLNFNFDWDTGLFEAFASEPMIIENKKLGYRLTYVLEEFKLNVKSGLISYYGYNSFEELSVKNERKASKFKEARDKAYLGSIVHFFSSLYSESTKAEGYENYMGRNLASGNFVIEKNQVNLAKLVKEGSDGRTKRLMFKELFYIYYMNEMGFKEHWEPVVNKGTLSFSGSGNSKLTVTRKEDLPIAREIEAKKMKKGRIELYRDTTFELKTSKTGKHQISWIQMKEGEEFIEFEPNGYIRNPLSFISHGQWSFEKVGDMVPIDYNPSKKTDNH